MADPITEYTVRDFTAVDEQIKQIAERERVMTQRLKLSNLRRGLIMGIAGLIAFGLFLVLAAWASRIAFPPEQKIIETVKVVEKIVQPPKIIIQTPEGSVVRNTDTVNGSTISSAPSSGVANLTGSAASQAIKETNQRLNSAGVSNSGSSAAISLTWNNYNDLDLVVREPNGNTLSYQKPKSQTSGALDVDANAGTRKTRTPIENIKWPDGKAPKGKYDIMVVFYKKATEESINGETPFRVNWSYGGETQVYAGKFANNTPRKKLISIASFTVD